MRLAIVKNRIDCETKKYGRQLTPYAESMKFLAGMKLKFKEMPEYGWYKTDYDDEYVFHESWLEFVDRKEEMTPKMKTESAFYVVMNSKLPTQISFKHTGCDAAIAEAKRLARKQAGDEFVVMKSYRSFRVENLIETDYEDNDYIPF